MEIRTFLASRGTRNPESPVINSKLPMILAKLGEISYLLRHCRPQHLQPPKQTNKVVYCLRSGYSNRSAENAHSAVTFVQRTRGFFLHYVSRFQAHHRNGEIYKQQPSTSAQSPGILTTIIVIIKLFERSLLNNIQTARLPYLPRNFRYI